MYFEVWVDRMRKNDVELSLKEVCQEVHEVNYDYHFIVKVSDSTLLNLNGIKKYREHYKC